MKRKIYLLGAVGLSVSLMAGVATASTLVISSNHTGTAAATSSLPYSFPSECFESPGTDEMHFGGAGVPQALKGKMYYKSTVPASDTLTITVGGGAYWKNIDSSGQVWAIYNSSTGALVTSNPTKGASTLTFPNTALNVDDYYYLGVTSTSEVGAYMAPGVNASGQTTASNVTVTMDFGGVASANATLVDYQNYYSVPTSSNGELDATADVAASRLKFTGNSTTVTGKAIRVAKQATSYTYVPNVAHSTAGIIAIANKVNECNDKMTYTLSTSDTSAISSVSMGGTVRTYGYVNTGVWVSSDTDMTGSGVLGGGTGFAASDNITEALEVNVNGTDIVNTRTWAISVAATGDSSSSYPDTTYTTSKSWGSWGVNGYQATTPYLSSNPNNYTVCKFFNASTSTAEVFVDVYPSDGSTAVTGLALTSIAANATGTYYGDAIATSAAISSEAYAARFTVAVSDSSVTGTCIMRGGNGQRVLPMYQSGGALGY